MQHLSTAFLIISLVIAVNQGGGVTAQDDSKHDQVAEESKNRAVTIIEGPQYVEQTKTIKQQSKTELSTPKPQQKPLNKPPIKLDKPVNQKFYINHLPRPYYGQIQKIPPPRHYHKPPLKLHHSPNAVYKYPKVIPLPPHYNKQFYVKSRPLVFAASTGRPTIAKSPKFSLPVQTINGIRSEFVKPPKHFNTTSTTTTDATTTTTKTTTKVLRTKRIWPKRILEKVNSTSINTTEMKVNTTKHVITNDTDYSTSESLYRIRYVYRNLTEQGSTTVQPLTTRGYRPVTRAPKIKATTTPTINFTHLEFNDWVPILPSHFPKINKPSPTPINKRSDVLPDVEAHNKRMLYLQTFGLVPVNSPRTPVMSRKKMVFFKSRRHLNPYYSGYSPKPVRTPLHPSYFGDLQTEGSHSRPRVVTKIKHHHHHHHHRYLKTIEKPVKVPYKVEVPKPYPVTVEKKVPVPVEKIKWMEKKVPYPITVEKRIPYPIGIRVPHPVPVKVVEKEYVPKPYPIIHHVPIIKHVEVKVPQPYPVQIEKRVPYPVEVKVPVPVDRPVPVQVTVEKKVPYPVPVKVLVPQPYPVETKVPYPVQVKVREPYEVIKHVQVKVPYPQPYPVKVPHPVPVRVEKRVPYPVEVEKKVPVPVPYEVRVPHRVEVEKKIPVYVPRPYPVEKKVPVPVKVPYPVEVPVKVPVEVPYIIHHPYPVHGVEDYPSGAGSVAVDDFPVTSIPQHTVTVHGNTGFHGFQSRSDKPETESTTAANNS